MKIPVIYVDLTDGIVDAHQLDLLIREEKIVSFRRNEDEWVRLGIDPVRGGGGRKYTGAERRLRQR
jgi:hemerythrin